MQQNIEDKTKYYYTNGKKVLLRRTNNIKVVRYNQKIIQPTAGLTTKKIEMLPYSLLSSYIPKYDFYIYDTKRETDSYELNRFKKILLDDENNIEFVSASYSQGSENKPDIIFTTKAFTVQFKPEASKKQIRDITTKNNTKIKRKLCYANNAYEMEAPKADGQNGPVALGNLFMETGKCIWAKASFIRRINFRFDSNIHNLENQQWNLEIAKVSEAWKLTKGDPNIKINICDDGIDDNHPEFLGKIIREYDFEREMDDASHKIQGREGHGTNCASVASAKGVRAFGAAPNCSLIISRIGDFSQELHIADAFFWASKNGADIISCSWGPNDKSGPSPLPDEIRAATYHCVTRGRQGKGCCIIWAAGNGDGESVDEDGYASNPYVIAVTASINPDTNGYEDRAPYCDIGKAVFISAPSNGGTEKILTADRIGPYGYNRGIDNEIALDHELGYTYKFGKTSAAAAFTSGVVALMLSANPLLTVDQVKEILCKTADKIGDQSTYNLNPTNGLSHSELYGYGRINAFKAVRASYGL